MDKFPFQEGVELSAHRSMQGKPILEVQSRTCKGCPLLALESTPRRREGQMLSLRCFLHDYDHTFEACHILAFVPSKATYGNFHDRI